MPDKWAQYAQPTAAIEPTAVQKSPGDKWQQYAKPAETADTSSKPDPGLRDQAENWINETFSDVPSDGSQSGGSRIAAGIHNLGSHGAKTIAAPFLHPIKMAEGFMPQSTPEKILGPAATAGRMAWDMGKGILKDYQEHGLGAAAGDAAGAYLLGKGTEAVVGAPGGLKRIVAGDVTKPIVGEGTTPLQRYNTAKNYGVQLNAADATNAPIPKMLRNVNEHSLTGSHVYEAAKGRNVEAVNRAADEMLNSMSPVSREEGGKIMQGNLEQNRVGLENGANDRYQDLSAAMGDKPMAGSEAVGATARKILEEEEPFNRQYPHLEPKQAMGIVRDVANRFKPFRTAPTSFLDAPDSEFAVPQEPAPPVRGLTYPEAQNIRSRTMDVTRRTNDLTADRGIGLLKQIVESTDDAIANSEGGLPPHLAETYRDANARWAEMKEKYDDPSSPLFHAIRTENPSTLVRGIGEQTPEAVRDLIPRIGPEGTGALQRGVAEHVMGVDKFGQRNLSGFGKRMERVPADYRDELYHPRPLFSDELGPQSDDYRGPIKDIGSITNVLEKDLNSSGTAKQGQKLAEAVALPTGLPLLQYPLARIMNSPKLVDWLMKPKGPRSPFVSPAAGAAGASGLLRNREREARQ
jgi:hypothetical protein